MSSDAGAKDKRKRDAKGSDKFAKKLKVAKAYVAKLEQQSADRNDSSSDDNEENDE